MASEEEPIPKGPNGERRPADVIGCAIAVAKIATGEVEDDRYSAPGRKRSGAAGGPARAAKLQPGKRSEIAREAANTRWK